MSATRRSTDLKTQAQKAVESHREAVLNLSQRIHANPELSGVEHQSSRWCADLLVEAGFDVEWVKGVDTAFVATRQGSSLRPTVAFLAEYDALPRVGHGCGHNLIAGSAVGAGLALASLTDALPGTIKVFGCPAEETGEGKPAMLAAGAFDDVDAALSYHANSTTSVMTACNGMRTFDLVFHGVAAHAGSGPWAGASALDGVLLTFQNLNALRQFMRDGVRLHGIITDGGQMHNVIPERAACKISVRAGDLTELDRVAARALDCAKAAALASATELEVQPGAAMDPILHTPALADLVRANLKDLGEEVYDWRPRVSTDFGNVSRRLPATLFTVATWPESVDFHTYEAADASGQTPAYEAMLIAAAAMAMTGVDLLKDSDALARVLAGFEEALDES